MFSLWNFRYLVIHGILALCRQTKASHPIGWDSNLCARSETAEDISCCVAWVSYEDPLQRWAGNYSAANLGFEASVPCFKSVIVVQMLLT